MTTRREFLRASGGAAAGFWIAGRQRGYGQEKSPNAKLNVACVGVGGMGGGNLKGVSGENVVALCDVDRRTLESAAKAHPAAAKHEDFRKMLETGKGIDAVVVSTPDHTHAAAAVMAMRLGKHCYCEKPLAHDVYETRVMTETARKTRVATQMGNRGNSSEKIRRTVELVRAGAIGTVKEVHTWTNRPIWPQALDRPPAKPVPEHLNWDFWLGPAPERPYHDSLHPFKWRGWWDFGTMALGDMACHIMNAPFWALTLPAPLAVEAEGEPRHPETGPSWMTVRYEFPNVKMTWYDGKRKDEKGESAPNLPSAELAHGQKISPGGGTLFIGDKGILLDGRVLPEARAKDFGEPPPMLLRCPGDNHYADWIEAAKGLRAACSNFDFAGPLTEIVLLGIVAYRTGKRLEWDAAAMRAKNAPEADAFLKREYRKGWTL